MRLSARTHHPVVHAGDTVPSHLVVSVSGEEGDRLRPPLGLVLVLDTSGSMAGSKHATVTAALDHLVGYLSDEDVVALVTFASEVRIPLAPVAIEANHSGARRFEAALRGVSVGGGTALDAGLEAGLALANQIGRQHPQHVVRVVLLTDGQANEGQCRPEMIAGRLASASDGVSLSTIGVGLDCDHDLLGLLAQRGSGSYGFVETPALAAEVLGTEIGGLVNLDAASVVVTVAGNTRYAELAAPLGVTSADLLESGWRVRLGHLVAGQTRTLVFPLRPLSPERAHARPVSVADVEAHGRVEGEIVTLAAKPKIHFASRSTQRDTDLDEAVDLAVLAQAVREAEVAAARHDFAASQGVLGAAQARLVTGGAATLMRGLVANYTNSVAYNTSSADRAAYGAVLSPVNDAIGVSTTVAAAVGRTLGGVTPSAARSVGLDTGAAVAAFLATNAAEGASMTGAVANTAWQAGYGTTNAETVATGGSSVATSTAEDATAVANTSAGVE